MNINKSRIRSAWAEHVICNSLNWLLSLDYSFAIIGK